MKTKKYLLFVIAITAVLTTYGANKERQSNGWEDFGAIGKIRSVIEKGYSDWEYDDKGRMIGTTESPEYIHIKFSRSGKERGMDRTFAGGKYKARCRKIIQYNANGKVIYTIKHVKNTQFLHIFEYYDANNKKKTHVRTVAKEGNRTLVVTRNLHDGSETTAVYLNNYLNWIVDQTFTYPDKSQTVRRFDYYEFDEKGNCTESIITTLRNGKETKELRTRTYTYY